VPYAFGDGSMEAQRLAIVDDVFGPASRALLDAVVSQPPGLAYDLGCGPGHTTRMVAEATRARQTVGLERSLAHVARAAGRADDWTRFVLWNVTEVPFPAGPADLIYARLLLAHLPDPVAAVRAWSGQLNQGGLVVLDEIEWIVTTDPVLRAHLDLVTARVATTGAQMCAGPVLAGVGDLPGLVRRVGQIVEIPVSTARAATMFAMNLAGWGDEAVADGLCGRQELTALMAAMEELRTSAVTGQITWGLHQAAYERVH
jgi:trans-aconitate 2-methyltransferase